eukprot:COSAG02_NODE_33570_length_498_cov_0.646617_1_plen_69_part_10
MIDVNHPPRCLHKENDDAMTGGYCVHERLCAGLKPAQRGNQLPLSSVILVQLSFVIVVFIIFITFSAYK